MKLSARNQLKGKVININKGAVNSIVTIDIGGGNIITATISCAAVEELGLEVGSDAYAVIKATNVMVELMNKLYTAQEIADKLQIKKTTVYELIKRGELYSSKVGKQLRISEQQLKQYLERSGSGNNMPDQKAASSSTPNGNLQIPGTSSRKFPFEEGLSSPLQRD